MEEKIIRITILLIIIIHALGLLVQEGAWLWATIVKATALGC